MKKSQVALEFLTTYGWAFLVVLVMIGALAYFGVLDPSNFLPEKCIFGAGVGCVEFAGFAGTTPAGSINARLVNGFGYTIVIKRVNSTVSGDGSVCKECLDSGADDNNWCHLATGDYSWLTEEQKEFNMSCPGLRKGSKPTVQVEITYKKADGTYDKVVKGEIQVKP